MTMTQDLTAEIVDSITLRPITSQNLKSILELSVSQEQKQAYPRSNAYSIAEGHYPPDDDQVWMRAIYAGEVPVGFLMTSEAEGRGEFFLWRLMVDRRHQGRGYGSRAVRLLIERIRATPQPRVLLTSHSKGAARVGAFYEQLGFSYTGEILNGHDRVMKIDFVRGDSQAPASSNQAGLHETTSP